MQTIDTILVHAPVERVWPHAFQVEQWPAILPHYRWVRRLRGETGADGMVEMSAWRRFGGPLNWPTWWQSEMSIDHRLHRVRYRHVKGITTGMDVLWTVDQVADGTRIVIVHEWPGPRWPLIGGIAANLVIGPVFIHAIASRTLAGIASAAGSGE